MSGGSFNYMCYSIEDEYKNQLHDDELNELLVDFIKVLHDLEWWQSGDYCADTYRKTVKDFKNKWLRQYNKELCYKHCPYKAITQAVKNSLEVINEWEQ